MSRVRNCSRSELRTGKSKCPIDLKRVKLALVLEKGNKLPDVLTASTLEQMCHDDRPKRVYPIREFVDFAREGGEVQTTNVGYGPVGPNGMSARRDTFTLDKPDFGLNASLLQNLGTKFDVYFIDANNIMYGYDDGTGVLAGFPMSAIFPDAPVFDAADKSPMTVSFCYDDIQDALTNWQSVQLDFNPLSVAYGLVGVALHEVSKGKYKVIEMFGGLDRTAEFGAAIQAGAESVLVGSSQATYAEGLLSITSDGTPTLASASALYAAEIKGIEFIRTEKAQA